MKVPRLSAAVPFLSLISHAASINLTVATSGGNSSTSTPIGIMFEDINHSGDGGIHGQLLRNNGFQGDDQNLTAYAAIGGASLAVDSSTPLNSAITHSLAVTIASDATGEAGFSNEGYWGIPVTASTYNTSFWIKGDYSGSLTLRLVGASSGTVFGSASVDVTATSDDWTYVQTTALSSDETAPDANNVWEVVWDDASAVAGQTIYFDLVALYGPTFKNRPNGLSQRIAEVMNELGGTFLRFPGGNNLEGASEDNRWKWNETIGPVEERPGRQGDWGYANTDWLGLIEYLEWSEDMGLENILGVWAGLSLDSGGNTPLTGDALQPYIDDVLNELEFLLGDSSTTYGAQRAALGYSEPFSIPYVEIGNEDHLSGGCETYASERFTRFHDAIAAVYPDIIIIASTNEADCVPSPFPDGAWQDYHTYSARDDLVGQFNLFDNWNRSIPIFVGEYANRDSDEQQWPYMAGGVSEAVFLIGIERNSDVVRMSAYAPTLQHVNGTQWVPDMVSYDASPSAPVKSTSYYVEQMFAANFGDTTREITSDTAFGPVYWSATAGSSSGAYYVKLANYGADEQSVSISIDGATGSASTTTLSGEETDANTLEAPDTVVPVTGSVDAVDGVFTVTMPAWSVVVLSTA
ncbi:Arabinosidase A [Phyllosticta capitalensis]|uniref:non-reducing end alpha-L-arabinofuranosidase n=1 Tax=Phyllosticta capitalensis TaxID=121624 RepID=A0ABR1Z0K1_9PEZI